MDRDAEIAEIRRELDILRARYASYERWGNVLKNFFKVWLPLFGLMMLITAITVFKFDIAYGVFFVVMMVVVGALFWLSGPPSNPNFWIDLASPITSPFRQGLFRRSPSDAQLIEEQIAQRVQRLADLGVPQ
jgi:hypothetical protein